RHVAARPGPQPDLGTCDAPQASRPIPCAEYRRRRQDPGGAGKVGGPPLGRAEAGPAGTSPPGIPPCRRAPGPRTVCAMSHSFARLVFLFTACFFAAFFIWPVVQILQGGFIDADGRLTFGFLGAVLTNP